MGLAAGDYCNSFLVTYIQNRHRSSFLQALADVCKIPSSSSIMIALVRKVELIDITPRTPLTVWSIRSVSLSILDQIPCVALLV